MRMSRGINLHFRSGKYPNAAESCATQMSAENCAYNIRNILTEVAEFRCQNCQFERTLCPAGTNLILAAGKFFALAYGFKINYETLLGVLGIRDNRTNNLG